jgi:competence protein ComGC
MENANSLANPAGIADANFNSMKLNCSNQRNHALTLIEVLVVIALTALIGVILLSMLEASNHKSARLGCVNCLKQIDLSFHIWEGDNGDKYPMFVSVTNGGAMELAAAGNASSVFQVMSNELSSPRILICPQDKKSILASNFGADFKNQNVSYFVGLDASEKSPQMLLSGDDNFEIGGAPVKSGLLEFSTNAPIAWSATRHIHVGNVAVTDGSVQQLTIYGLQTALVQTASATNRILIP